MAESTIKQLMNESDEGYCKMPDGTLICWASNKVLTASGSLAQIGSTGIYSAQGIIWYFPCDFVNGVNCVVTGNSKYDTGHCLPIAVEGKGPHSCTIRVYDFYARSMNDGKFVFNLMAVGRWK